MNKFSDIEEKIKSKFRLFTGIRPVEEDQKIYDKVYDACFDEILNFLSDHLSESELDNLNSDLEKISQLDLVLSHLKQIENYRFKLDRRLNYFLDNLLNSSLRKLKEES